MYDLLYILEAWYLKIQLLNWPQESEFYCFFCVGSELVLCMVHRLTIAIYQLLYRPWPNRKWVSPHIRMALYVSQEVWMFNKLLKTVINVSKIIIKLFHSVAHAGLFHSVTLCASMDITKDWRTVKTSSHTLRWGYRLQHFLKFS